MGKGTFCSFLLLVLAVAPISHCDAQEVQSIKVAKGQTADLWFGVNVSGTLHLSVRTRNGTNKMTIWWITWGTGSTQSIGVWGPDGSLDTPITWWKGVVSAKLRGTAADDTVVYISEKVAIDKSVTFNW